MNYSTLSPIRHDLVKLPIQQEFWQDIAIKAAKNDNFGNLKHFA